MNKSLEIELNKKGLSVIEDDSSDYTVYIISSLPNVDNSSDLDWLLPSYLEEECKVLEFQGGNQPSPDLYSNLARAIVIDYEQAISERLKHKEWCEYYSALSPEEKAEIDKQLKLTEFD